MKALAIDDSRAIRRILSRMLSDSCFEVREAGDRVEAPASLKEYGAPDLAFVDWDMPNMNGYDYVVDRDGAGPQGSGSRSKRIRDEGVHQGCHLGEASIARHHARGRMNRCALGGGRVCFVHEIISN